uniref:Uncharacterized protein n=1 Tax=Nicotiana tabacum TaxID=4097 RepID=A0A1S3Z3J4_TOBAC|nr:PREDICTED: uncharacterized protein LOC107782381 [Nicotiana tabacum]
MQNEGVQYVGNYQGGQQRSNNQGQWRHGNQWQGGSLNWSNQGNQGWNKINQGNRNGGPSQNYNQQKPYNSQGQSSGDPELRVNKEATKEAPKSYKQLFRPLPPFPQRFFKQQKEGQLQKFYNMLNQITITMPFVEALGKMPGYAKFMKNMVTKKKNVNFEIVKVIHQCSAIISQAEVKKMEDPGAFTISCTIGVTSFAKALCDLRASINLMLYDVFKKLGLGDPRPTSMKIFMADRTLKKLLGVIDDILVKVGRFYFPADFVILDCEVDREVPIILGRPILATGQAICDVEVGELKFA